MQKQARKDLVKEEKEWAKLEGAVIERGLKTTQLLIKSAESGWTPSVEKHLAAGALVNEMAETGTTALTSAARWGHLEVMDVLLAAGADPDIVIDPSMGGCTALWKATSANEIAALQTLLNAGADPDIPNYLGDTPLGFAARENSVECVQILLAAGADPDIQNKHGWSAMHGAVLEGNVVVVKLLLAYGCGDIQEEDGEFLYEFAVGKNEQEIAAMLKKAGAVEPSLDPRSLLEKNIRVSRPVTLNRTLLSRLGLRKKGIYKSSTGLVVDYGKSGWLSKFRFRVQFECEPRNLAKKKRWLWCCGKKPTEYNFSKLERRVRLKRRVGALGSEKGKGKSKGKSFVPFVIIDRLYGSTTSVPYSDELLRQPKQASSSLANGHTLAPIPNR
jgi:ankyrin repeat protein